MDSFVLLFEGTSNRGDKRQSISEEINEDVREKYFFQNQNITID